MLKWGVSVSAGDHTLVFAGANRGRPSSSICIIVSSAVTSMAVTAALVSVGAEAEASMRTSSPTSIDR